MKYTIEDAVIIATYEHEVKFPVETVTVEPLRREKKPKSLFTGLFDFFDLFFGSDYEEPEEEIQELPEPEPAVITATYEQRIEEIHFAYYELID